jgi:hypothetical protein
VPVILATRLLILDATYEAGNNISTLKWQDRYKMHNRSNIISKWQYACIENKIQPGITQTKRYSFILWNQQFTKKGTAINYHAKLYY